MKRKALFIAAILVMCPLVFGQTCPEQIYSNLGDCPFAYDPNQVALDPYSGQRLSLGWVAVELGHTWTWDGWACDPDGDAVVFSADAGTLIQEGVVYTLSGQATSIGLHYYNVTVTDVPDPALQPKPVTGTLVVAVLPSNNAPVLCGGRPSN